MEDYEIFCLIGFILMLIVYILINYNIKYKGKCILHDWEYRFEYGKFWIYTGTFLRKNERYECKKCWKEKKY